MISHLIAMPMITFADMKCLLLEEMGAPVMHASREYYPEKGYKIHHPPVIRSYIDLNFVYAQRIKDFLMLEDRLTYSAHKTCVILGETLPVLEEYSISPSYTHALTVKDVTAMVTQEPTYKGLAPRVRKTAQSMLDEGGNNLLLPKIHPLFYRIPDKARRENARKAAFAYLTGLARTYTHTGVPALDRLLESDLAFRTRQLVQMVLASDLEKVLEQEKDADEFELRYLIAKHVELKKSSR